MKKKIAIITNGAHFDIGGVENYSRIFYEHFSDKYQIVEFPTLNIKKNNTNNIEKNPNIVMDYSLLGRKPQNIVWSGSYTRKNFKKVFDNFDIVIMNTIFLPAKWFSHPKAIVVQHMHKDWYGIGGKKPILILGQLLNHLFFNVTTIRNALKNTNNVVFFSRETEISSKAKKTYIPLAYKKNNEFIQTYHNRQGFVWIGRLDNYQKNVKAIVKLANLHNDIKIYGDGYSKNIIDKHLINQNQYFGHVYKKEITEIYQKAKCLLLTSNYEGFPFVIVEALSNGTPVIMFDTFDATKFFVKSGAVFLIKKGDFHAFNEKINFLRNLSSEEYEKISQKALDFARKNLTKESFWNKWEQFINQFKN